METKFEKYKNIEYFDTEDEYSLIDIAQGIKNYHELILTKKEDVDLYLDKLLKIAEDYLFNLGWGDSNKEVEARFKHFITIYEESNDTK